jgi:ATP-binding cassette, subfamily B, multidrug efflux pump
MSDDGVQPNGQGETAEPAKVIKPPQPVRSPFGRGPMIGVPAEKSENFRASAMRLVRRLRGEGLKIGGVLTLAVASVVLLVLGPRVLGSATNTIVSGVTGNGIDFTRLHRTLLFALGLYISSAALGYMQAYVLAGIVQRTMSRLRTEVEEKLNRLPLRDVDRMPRGDLLSRVTNDIDNLSQSLQQTLSQMLTSFLTIIGVLIMMVSISPLLALVAIVTVPISLFTISFITRRSKSRFVAQWDHTGTLNAQVEEVFTGHELVKVFGRQHDAEQTFDKENEYLFQASFGAQFISGTIQPVMMFIGNLNYVAIAVIGGLRVANGSLSLGDVQAFLQYTRQYTQPLTQLASMANLLQSGIASAERVFELLDSPEESEDPKEPLRDENPRGRVEFSHVRFAYSPDRPLIKDLSLVAEPGQTVAIVGPTGAGKTTLVNLLMRFYEIDGGTISVDGNDTSKMTRRDLRANIGMVLQDTWLFGGTIKENIAFGNLEASDEQILEAARATYVDRFVHTLSDGYESVLDDEKGSVSAGEKQLLTIARAFLADPTILILDEATSSVDTRTEVLIQRAMSALRSNRTSFVIAHRLSTIRDADIILVMEDGDIVEQGNHEELLTQKGAYYRLYQAQFAAAAVDVG